MKKISSIPIWGWWLIHMIDMIVPASYFWEQCLLCISSFPMQWRSTDQELRFRNPSLPAWLLYLVSPAPFLHRPCCSAIALVQSAPMSLVSICPASPSRSHLDIRALWYTKTRPFRRATATINATDISTWPDTINHATLHRTYSTTNALGQWQMTPKSQKISLK
jgi:hypothetical protein